MRDTKYFYSSSDAKWMVILGVFINLFKSYKIFQNKLFPLFKWKKTYSQDTSVRIEVLCLWNVHIWCIIELVWFQLDSSLFAQLSGSTLNRRLDVQTWRVFKNNIMEYLAHRLSVERLLIATFIKKNPLLIYYYYYSAGKNGFNPPLFLVPRTKLLSDSPRKQHMISNLYYLGLCCPTSDHVRIPLKRLQLWNTILFVNCFILHPLAEHEDPLKVSEAAHHVMHVAANQVHHFERNVLVFGKSWTSRRTLEVIYISKTKPELNKLSSSTFSYIT